MKQIILSLISISLFCNCFSQNREIQKKLAFINNEVKYYIVQMACNTCTPISNVGYKIMTYLSDEEKKEIKNINYDSWIQLLDNPNTDWGANLILYSIYDKDAFLLRNFNSKKLWVKSLKAHDLEYWKQNLLKKLNRKYVFLLSTIYFLLLKNERSPLPIHLAI